MLRSCVWQIRETAANVGLILAGENALPLFSPSGIDAVALERIVYNTRVRPKGSRTAANPDLQAG